MKNYKVDGILAPEEVSGTENKSYEQQLGIALFILMVVGIIAVAWK